MTADSRLPSDDVEDLFRTGTLGQKRAEFDAVVASNGAALFAGAVCWSIFLPAEYKKLKGTAASLSEACGFMSGSLKLLSQEYADDAEVLCVVEADGRS